MSENIALQLAGIAILVLHSIVDVGGQAKGILPDRPEMILVEGGSFLMGDEVGGQDLFTSPPSHRVTMSSFYMARYEVTIGLWKQFAAEEKLDFDWEYEEFLSEGGIRNLAENDPRPAYYMTWYNAIHFCNWLSKKNGLDTVYTFRKRLYPKWDLATRSFLRPEIIWNRKATGYRLPTEAEWEYAARGGRYSKGYAYSGSNNIKDVAWFWTDANEVPGPLHPVGQKKPNELGLYDMSGNVSEYCWDYFDLTYYSRSSGKDPTGPGVGYVPQDEVDFDQNYIPYLHSRRGGDVNSPRRLCQIAARTPVFDVREGGLCGIRLARNAR